MFPLPATQTIRPWSQDEGKPWEVTLLVDQQRIIREMARAPFLFPALYSLIRGYPLAPGREHQLLSYDARDGNHCLGISQSTVLNSHVDAVSQAAADCPVNRGDAGESDLT